MSNLYVYAGLCVGISFTCSLMEAAFLSTTNSHVQLMVNQNHRSGLAIKALKEHVDRPLAAILTLNTIANTAGATAVGAEAANIYGDEMVGLISGILTFVILIFGEIIPKTLGANYWKQLVPITAVLVRFMILVTYPFVMVLRVVSRLISPQNQVVLKGMSREEMIVAAETGVAEGVLHEKEQRIIKNLLRLHKILAKDVMTPRSVVFALAKDATIGEVMTKKAPVFFSRIPVFDRDLDDVVGMVLRFRILEAYSQDRDHTRLEDYMTSIHSVSENAPIGEILDEFLKRREHLFLVSQEHGGTAGIITLEDVIETLLGVEIVDEFDSVEDMRKYALEQLEQRMKLRNYKYPLAAGGMPRVSHDTPEEQG